MRNFVAKHARTYNKAAVHTDKKKNLKNGNSKHKPSYEDDYYSIAIFPDGMIYSLNDIPEWRGDDYEIRQTMCCPECQTELYVSYSEPFAHCECGTQEWYL